MKLPRSIYFLFFFLSICFPLLSQQSKIDSLHAVWKDVKQKDTVQLKALHLICERFTDSNPDSAVYYSDFLIKDAEKKGQKKFIALGFHVKAWALFRKGESQKAYESLSKAITLYEAIGFQSGLGNAYNSMAAIFGLQKDSLKVDEYHAKALKIFENINDKAGIATVLSNMSTIPGRKHTKENLIRALQLYKEVGNKRGIATTLFKLAQEKLVGKKSNVIPEEYFQCLKTFEELNNKVWISYLHAAISEMYFQRGEFQKAIDYSKKGYEIAKANDLSKEKMDNLRVLIAAYPKINNYKEAFHLYHLLVSEKDSVTNLESGNSILKQEMAYVYEKREALEKKEQEKKLAIVAEQEKMQQIVIYSIGIVLILVIVFAIIISKRLRLTRKQKNIIDEQKKSTEKQKEIIEEKQKEIIDSINYAKRLQNAILPTEDFIKLHLPDSFVLYKPKAIVAGDFYWLESVSPMHVGADLIFIAAADCTGHGVPGAIVSMICHNALNRALLEYEITDPGKILNIVRELVIATFEKSDTDVKDGMDISLCCINNKTKEIFWAGANNPLWIISANDKTLTEFSPNKQPIGKIDNPLPFTTKKMQLAKGDLIYLFTDGYADQFGGPKGKKFKYKQLQDVLLKHFNETMEVQKEALNSILENWRGDLEQVDDICFVGIKL